MIGLYEMRFVKYAEPGDEIVDDPVAVEHWKRTLAELYLRSKAAPKEFLEGCDFDVRRYAENLKKFVWTPERTVLVKHTVR